MTGHRCDSLKESVQTENPLPDQCFLPVANYAHDKKVQEQCSLVERWSDLAKKPAAEGRCKIDPETKKMICKRDDACTGGERNKAHVTTVTRNITYNCEASCQGALLFDCCETCNSYQNDPRSLQVNHVACLGCDTKKLASAGGAVDCMMKDGQFHCRDVGSCASGVVETSCEVSDFTCDVYPCDSCTDTQLKAKCCVDCLTSMCGSTPSARMTCRGCEALPGQHGWWPFR